MALYHSTSNGPVEVKKHQLMGPVGYTVVGNPTIVDGIASGFSSSDYLNTSAKLQVSSGNLLVRIKFKTSSVIASGNTNIVYFGDILTNTNCIRLYKFESYGTFINVFNRDFFPGQKLIEEDTWYVLEVILDGNSFVVNLYNNNGIKIGSGTAQQYTITLDGIGRFGGKYNNTIGSIDLNETYIKVNDQLWFYQPAPTKYIQKDDKLVFADSGLYLSGPVNYEVVGSPTIVDNVASGFSKSNYLNLTSAFNPGSSTFECVFDIITGNSSTTQTIFRSCVSAPSQAGRVGLLLGINNSRRLFLNTCSNGTSWEGERTGPTTLSLSTPYKIKLAYDGTSFTVLCSENGGVYTTEISVTRSHLYNALTVSQIGIFSYNNAYAEPFLGSFNLNETYIKVDDQLWFYGKNYASKNIAPVPANYTYGTTTTPSIGYVDMRTQQFTAAPSGATIGRDE